MNIWLSNWVLTSMNIYFILKMNIQINILKASYKYDFRWSCKLIDVDIYMNIQMNSYLNNHLHERFDQC